MWIAGGNDNVVRYNHFYNNWRRGVMLFAVPDATICGPGPLSSSVPVDGCDPTKFSTSYRNKFYGNTMGVAPSGKVERNGVDFWWDDFPTNTGNCWHDNTAAPGKKVTKSPGLLPNCALLPSIGLGSTNELELLACFGATLNGTFSASLCPWFKVPVKPAPSAGPTAEPKLSGVPGLLDSMCSLYRDAKTTLCAGRH
jgi:hypothetical protein